jgi:long-chain acyl-CoA synthetase
MMENHPAFFTLCWAAQRAGLYYTAISYRLQEEEVAYIVEDCEAKVFITTHGQRDLAEPPRGALERPSLHAGRNHRGL